jgi:DNA-binding response OmpR family regulator
MSAEDNGHSGTRSCLLVPEDNLGAAQIATALEVLPLRIIPAGSVAQALDLARLSRFELLIIGLDLPDMDGLAAIRVLSPPKKHLPFIVVTARATVPRVVQAMKLGAADVLEAPPSRENITAAVCSALTPNHVPVGMAHGTRAEEFRCVDVPSSAAERVAYHILRVVESKHDPKTVAQWAAEICTSVSSLREHCRLAKLKAHDARDFSRILRVICRSNETWCPEALLDCSDLRTLKKLMDHSGLKSQPASGRYTVYDFLDSQKWIPHYHPTLAALRAILLERSLRGWTSRNASSRPTQ